MLGEIENIKIKEMQKLPLDQLNSYVEVLKLLRPVPKLGTRKAKNIFDLQFAEVENMKREVNTSKGILKSMSVFFGCPENLLVDYRIVDFYHALNHLLSQIEHIQNLERTNLNRKPKQEMIDAGIRELDKFGALNTLDQLAKEYGKSPLEVEQWSYGLIYSLMWKRRIESEIEENRLEAIKSKK